MLKKIMPIIYLVAIGLPIVFFSVILPSFVGARDTGVSIGTNLGEDVGSIKGKIEAEKDKKQGAIDGKLAGLSAEDTVIEVKGRIQNVGKMDVLVAGISLDNFHRLGNDYAALYLMKADAVFSIDLGRVQVESISEGTQLLVTIPQPEITIYYDEAEMKKATEWQKNYFSKNAEDGFTAYLNSMIEMEENAPVELAKNETLMNIARESAKKQITLLISNISGTKKKITINFEE